MAIVLEPGVSGEIVLQPSQSSDVPMLLSGITIPGGRDNVVAQASVAPSHWQVEVGFLDIYQDTTTFRGHDHSPRPVHPSTGPPARE